MTRQNLIIETSPYRSSGWATIVSGIIGILGIGFIIGYLISRSESGDTWILMNRLHDGADAIQFLLLIPFVNGVHRLLQQKNYQTKHTTKIIGVSACIATSLSLLLIFPKLVSEIFYMIPQGIFGWWLILINLNKSKFISKSLRIFGGIVGIGLLLAGIFPIGFALFVSMDALRIPAAPQREFPQTAANGILHLIFFIGSVTGVLTLPFWSILGGIKLLKEKPAANN